MRQADGGEAWTRSACSPCCLDCKSIGRKLLRPARVTAVERLDETREGDHERVR